jgi:hypothetical protein
VQPSTHLDDGRSRYPGLVNLLTVVDHEQIRNLLCRASGHSEELVSQIRVGTAIGPSVTIATARDVGAGTEAVSGRIAEVPLWYPRHL